MLEQLFLERTLRALESNGSLGFAGCWLRAFGGADFDWAPERCDFPHLLAEDTVCTPALTRREPLLEVGGFDTQMPVAGYEDWEVAISLVEAAYSGTIVPEYLFRYRVRAGSMTATCTAPENHARLMEYIVDKHQETYQRFLPGVIAVIQRRTADLEGRLDTLPPRPDVAHAGWRDAVLALENHRRALEASALAPEPDTSREAIEWGLFRHLSPVSRVWGLDRGRPVDRYYIEQFLQRHAQDITGRILEVKDATYSSRFGAGVTAIDVVDIASENPDATLVADLGKPGSLPKNRFDCFILTQTVHIVYEAEEVVRNAFRTLRPGGAVLVTLPCVSRIDYESGVDGDFWRFTPASARRLFEGVFGPENVEIESSGNVLACTAFLQGMAQEELHPQELVHNDPDFPLLVTVRAAEARFGRKSAPRSAGGAGAVRGRRSRERAVGSAAGGLPRRPPRGGYLPPLPDARYRRLGSDARRPRRRRRARTRGDGLLHHEVERSAAGPRRGLPAHQRSRRGGLPGSDDCARARR